MNLLYVSRNLRPLVVMVMMVLVSTQGLMGLQVSPPAGNGGAVAPRDCDAERAARIADAKAVFDSELAAINRRFATKVKGCQNVFGEVDTPACLQAYADKMKALGLQTFGTTATCGVVCLISVIPPAVMAPACANCIGLVSAAVIGQAADAGYTKTRCLDEAVNKAKACATAALDESTDEMDDALDDLRMDIARANNDYEKCKASVGG